MCKTDSNFLLPYLLLKKIKHWVSNSLLLAGPWASPFSTHLSIIFLILKQFSNSAKIASLALLSQTKLHQNYPSARSPLSGCWTQSHSAEIVDIRMGSGDWFKTIIGKKKAKDEKSKQQMGGPASDKSNGSKSNSNPMNTSVVANGACGRNDEANAIIIISEDTAAIRIQKAYRAYRARKSLLRLKGIVRLHKLIKGEAIKKQSAGTLTYLHAWSRIQAQIKERRLSMAAEGHLKQKKMENQLKLEAKLHDLEVEWSDGFEALDDILTRIHQREEAAVKRERALAYAFTHQRRPNSSNQGVNASEIGKASWEWSWKERWVVARPWETRVPSKTVTPKSGKSNQTNKAEKNTNPTSHKSLPVKSKALNGKGPIKARRLSFPGTEAPPGEEKPKG